MSLLKVTLIIITFLGHELAIYRPRIPSKDEEERAANGKGYSVPERLIKNLPISHHFTAGSVFLAETAVTYAVLDPLNPWSRRVLDFLSPDEGASLPIFISPLFVAGVTFTVLGALIRVFCYRTLGRFFTYRLAIHSQHKLVTTGPYSIVRHPSYTGLILVRTGITMCLAAAGSWWRGAGMWSTFGGAMTAWWVFVCWYTIRIAGRAWQEDEMLRREFGETWDQYAKRVPYRYVPMLI